MSEQNRKELLSDIRKIMREEQHSSIQTEYDRMNLTPEKVPTRQDSMYTVNTSGTGEALGRRNLSAAATKRTKTMIGIPSVGAHEEHSWSTNTINDHVNRVVRPQYDVRFVEDSSPQQPQQPQQPQPQPQPSRPPGPQQDPAPAWERPAQEEYDEVEFEYPVVPTGQPSLEQTNNGDYCLLFKGNVIAVDPSPEKILSFINSLFRTFSNVNKDEIMVFKRVGYKIGAHFD